MSDETNEDSRKTLKARQLKILWAVSLVMQLPMTSTKLRRHSAASALFCPGAFVTRDPRELAPALWQTASKRMDSSQCIQSDKPESDLQNDPKMQEILGFIHT